MQIPVTILTGFLGSGKTTLLNHLLREPALCDAAVIINEFGEIGLDHLLVCAPAENIVLLDTGCLCCTVRGDLVQTLTDLNEKRTRGTVPPFCHLIVETTGLADPVPLLQTIVADDALNRAYRLHDVATTVDAVNGAAQLDQQPESVKQAAVADHLLVTKCDIAAPGTVRALVERLARLNPGADIHEVVRGQVDAAAVLRGNVYDPRTKGAEVARWLGAERYARVAMPRQKSGSVPDFARAAAHDLRVRSFSFIHERPIRQAGLMMWLDMLAGLKGANLLRVKALLNVEGEPVVVHAVQSVVHEPIALDAWPDADRRSRLVFIAREMEREDIERTFAAFDYAPQIAPAAAIDPHAYAQFVAAMKGFGSRDEGGGVLFDAGRREVPRPKGGAT